MDALGLAELIFAALVLVTGYAVRSTTGFGGQALAVPLLALVMPLTVVVPAITVLTVLASVRQLWVGWKDIVWIEVARLAPCTLVGILVGLYLLRVLDVRTLTRAFGVFVVLYACFSLTTAARPVRIATRFRYATGAAMSTAAGVTGTVFGGAAGTLYVIYLTSVGLLKSAFRATISTILMVQALARIAGYTHLGLYERADWLLIAAGFPLMLVGSRIGDWLAGRLDQHRFNIAIGLLMLASGAALALK